MPVKRLSLALFFADLTKRKEKLEWVKWLKQNAFLKMVKHQDGE